jgi:uncharacterized protein (TIGR04255 family)
MLGQMRKRATVRQRYGRPPITEAVIHISVEPAKSTTFDTLAALTKAVASDYPTVHQRVRGELQIKVPPDDPASPIEQTRTVEGLVYQNREVTRVFQARLSGFSFSQLPPYTAWEDLRDDARALWDLYRSTAQPARVTRAAVRFINRIDLPLPSVELTEYLRTVPQVSPDLPQFLSGFFFQLQIPLPELPGTAIINQTIAPPAIAGGTSIIFDIDVFSLRDFQPGDSELWDFFEILHDVENEIFEASITDRVREVIR